MQFDGVDRYSCSDIQNLCADASMGPWEVYVGIANGIKIL